MKGAFMTNKKELKQILHDAKKILDTVPFIITIERVKPYTYWYISEVN